MEFENGEKVIVHSLGCGKLYRAEIVGIASKFHHRTKYIIKMIDRFRSKEYRFDCCCISEYHLKKYSVEALFEPYERKEFGDGQSCANCEFDGDADLCNLADEVISCGVNGFFVMKETK